MRRALFSGRAVLPSFRRSDPQYRVSEASTFHVSTHSWVCHGLIYVLLALAIGVLFCSLGSAQQFNAPDPPSGTISGTIMDNDSDVIPDATVILQGPATEPPQTITSNDMGAFTFQGVTSDMTYYLIVRANDCLPWTSAPLRLEPGQFLYLPPVKLMLSGGSTSVTVAVSSAAIATEQVQMEEQQRVLGFIPNFYVSYAPHPAPLTPKLKFALALRLAVDPVTFAEYAAIAGMDQTADTPNYTQGAKGYGQRLGANYANGFVDIVVGSAILPSLLHQDPRYFYRGTGTAKSRFLYAISRAFICRGDNGGWQPNYSAIGGDLVAGAVSNAYYPASNRGVGLVFQNSLVMTGARMAGNVLEEFVLRRFTTHSHDE